MSAIEAKRIPASKPYTTLPAAAARLGCCEMTVRRCLKVGELTAYRFTERGGPYLVRIADVEKLAEKRGVSV